MPTHRAARIAAAPRNWNYQQHNKTAASDCGVEPPGTIVEECRRAPRGSQPLAAHHIAFAIWPTTTRRAGLLLQLASTCPFFDFSLSTSDIAVAAAVVRGRCKMAAMDWGDCAGGMARPNKLLGKRPNPSSDCSGRSRKLLGLPLFRTRKACARSFPRRFPSVVPHSANFARNPRNHATRRQRARRRGPRLPHCTAYSFSSLA